MRRPVAATFGATALLAFAASARAQPVKPNILLIFDTSGSMELNPAGMVTGEGTNICPTGTDSRLYLLKRAVRGALAQTGVDEANFGLLSFPTQSNPAATPACYACCSIADPGRTYAGHYYIDNPDGEDGCGMTTHTKAGHPGTYGPWFDGGLTQVLRVDVTGAAAGTRPAWADFDPPDANLARVFTWIDDREDPGPAPAGLLDPELHAMGSTPLGRSLFFARLYFEEYVMRTDRRACRQNLIILVTDGFETCDAAAGALDIATCSFMGSGSAFHPFLQACRLLHDDGIKTYVLTDASVTGSSNDTIARLGGTGKASRVTLTDSDAVKERLVEIIAGAVPPAERCNGEDDNCNGLVDEGVANACPWDPAAPSSDGGKHCAVEACNCLDDDCDGLTDQGLPLNACGRPCGCKDPEVCNGKDDDCDGIIDDAPGVGDPCDNGLPGACRRPGSKECKADGSGLECNAPGATGTPEICNGVDDDCDGMTDEPDGPGGKLPGEGEPCGSDLGVCRTGTTVCRDGAMACQTTAAPQPETCNGIDDDCNGITDDGTFPETGASCRCIGLDPALFGVGECHPGHLVCRGLLGFVCEGCGLPVPELCDGKDNDCDGTTDFAAPCPGGFSCQEGQCAVPCGTGEFPCPGCYACNPAGYCIFQRCCGVRCDAGATCDPRTGTCRDLCAGVSCPAPQSCRDGRCVDCFTTGCADTGTRCIDGACAPDPCAGVTCLDDQFCDAGRCVGLCTGVTCPKGQACHAGRCADDPCAAVACPAGRYCDPDSGGCLDDPCATSACGPGLRCSPRDGSCGPDPCQVVSCLHPCLHCETTPAGEARCVADDVCANHHVAVAAGGGRGCSCAATSPAGMGGRAYVGAACCLLVGRRRKMRRAP